MPRKQPQETPEKIISKTFNKIKFSTDYKIRQIVDWGRESGRYRHEGEVIDEAIDYFIEEKFRKAGIALRNLPQDAYRTRPKQKS